MIFDCTSDRIICISYPTGGYGNFIYQILMHFCKETIEPPDTSFLFSSTGDSHNMPHYTNVYFHDPDIYDPLITLDFKDKQIPILCDNGISNDQYTKLRSVFPNARIVRTIIDKAVRPIVYQNMVIKAHHTTLTEFTYNQVNANWTDSDQDYAIRENFTLQYHNWPYDWQPIDEVVNLSIEHLIFNSYDTILDLMSKLNLTPINLHKLPAVLDSWKSANHSYFDVYINSKNIMQALDNGQNMDLTKITNLHEQGYINYCIEVAYNVTIPVYDYRNWFKNTTEIKSMIDNLCSE